MYVQNTNQKNCRLLTYVCKPTKPLPAHDRDILSCRNLKIFSEEQKKQASLFFLGYQLHTCFEQCLTNKK